MAEHTTVQVLSPPPCVCAGPLVGAASFTSLRAAASSTPPPPASVPAAGEAAAGKCSWEDAVIAAGMIAVQLAGAAYMVVLSPAMERGLDPLFLVTFGSLTNAAFTLPFAVSLERRLLPPPDQRRITARLLLQFLLLAGGGVTGFQALMLQGMRRTSPAIAAAMPNLTPGFIFVVAACLGFERVRLRCGYTWAKIVGTVICLAGAVTMSVLQNTASSSPSPAATSESSWAAGCFCLLGAVVVVSCTTVLQAATMVRFPAPITLCTVTSLLGAVLTAAFQMVARGSLDAGGGLGIGLRAVAALVVGGGVVSSACVAFQAWALKKKGPVVVSMFSPTQTVGSAVFSAIFLGRVVKPGSVVGMILLFSGLYVVLWAKKKETISSSDDSCSSMAVANKDGDDLEKEPLLSRRH